MNNSFYKDNLKVEIYDTRDEMGIAAATDIKNKIKELLKTKEELSM